MRSAHDVAARLLADLGPMTAMKLEKLVYYGQAWHLAREGEPLFRESIEAWREGPVVPELYARHRGRYSVATWSPDSPSEFSAAEQATIDWVEETYGPYSAERL